MANNYNPKIFKDFMLEIKGEVSIRKNVLKIAALIPCAGLISASYDLISNYNIYSETSILFLLFLILIFYPAYLYDCFVKYKDFVDFEKNNYISNSRTIGWYMIFVTIPLNYYVMSCNITVDGSSFYHVINDTTFLVMIFAIMFFSLQLPLLTIKILKEECESRIIKKSDSNNDRIRYSSLEENLVKASAPTLTEEEEEACPPPYQVNTDLTK